MSALWMRRQESSHVVSCWFRSTPVRHLSVRACHTMIKADALAESQILLYNHPTGRCSAVSARDSKWEKESKDLHSTSNAGRVKALQERAEEIRAFLQTVVSARLDDNSGKSPMLLLGGSGCTASSSQIKRRTSSPRC